MIGSVSLWRRLLGGVGGSVVLLSAAGGAHRPLATYPCPSLEPSPSVGAGAHRPPPLQCPPSPPSPPARPTLTSPTPPSLPSVGCATAAPGLSLCHCPVSGPHGGGRRPSPLAKGVQVDTPTPAVGGPDGGLWAPGGEGGSFRMGAVEALRSHLLRNNTTAQMRDRPHLCHNKAFHVPPRCVHEGPGDRRVGAATEAAVTRHSPLQGIETFLRCVWLSVP